MINRAVPEGCTLLQFWLVVIHVPEIEQQWQIEFEVSLGNQVTLSVQRTLSSISRTVGVLQRITRCEFHNAK